MNQPRRRGVTVVELLVVVVATLSLMGILLPALVRVDTSALQMRCQSNLRVMSQASMLYSINYRGHFPPAVLYGTDEDANRGDVRGWDFWKQSGGLISPGLLWTFTDHPGEVLSCPGFPGLEGNQGEPHTGYNYNTAFIAAEGRRPWGLEGGSWDFIIEKDNLDGQTALTLAECRRPASVALFGLGAYRDGANKFMRSPVNASPQDMSLAHAGTQGFHYGGQSHFVCIDGHLESTATAHRGELFDELPSSMTEVMGWPNNGFLSADSDRYDPR